MIRKLEKNATFTFSPNITFRMSQRIDKPGMPWQVHGSLQAANKKDTEGSVFLKKDIEYVDQVFLEQLCYELLKAAYYRPMTLRYRWAKFKNKLKFDWRNR